MFDNIDPAKKQYFIFSAVVAIIISAVINFAFIDVLKGTFAYGFPLSLANAVGVGAFVTRIVNSIVMGLILAPLLYYLIRWLQTRGSGGY